MRPYTDSVQTSLTDCYADAENLSVVQMIYYEVLQLDVGWDHQQAF